MATRVDVDPRIHFGRPCVKNTGITGQAVLELLREGLSFEELIADYYPDLGIEDIPGVPAVRNCDGHNGGRERARTGAYPPVRKKKELNQAFVVIEPDGLRPRRIDTAPKRSRCLAELGRGASFTALA